MRQRSVVGCDSFEGEGCQQYWYPLIEWLARLSVVTAKGVCSTDTRFRNRGWPKWPSPCTDEQWKVILYLCRVAGMRCPTEVVAARFSDIDWQQNRMNVHCVKTSGHEGRAIRQIPLWPELRDVLQKA